MILNIVKICKKKQCLIVYYFGSHGSSWTLAVTELKHNLHYHNYKANTIHRNDDVLILPGVRSENAIRTFSICYSGRARNGRKNIPYHWQQYLLL